MKNKSPMFRLGAAIAASEFELTHGQLLQKEAGEAVINGPEAEAYHRELCKIACAAFEVDEDTHCPEAILFSKLASAPQWHTSFHRFTDCVRRALGKQAGLFPVIAATHDKLGGGMLKTLTAGGALGGAALGSLAFMLSRNAQQSSAENETLLEKVRAFKQLKQEIKEDMSSNLVMEDTGKRKKREETTFDV